MSSSLLLHSVPSYLTFVLLFFRPKIDTNLSKIFWKMLRCPRAWYVKVKVNKILKRVEIAHFAFNFWPRVNANRRFYCYFSTMFDISIRNVQNCLFWCSFAEPKIQHIIESGKKPSTSTGRLDKFLFFHIQIVLDKWYLDSGQWNYYNWPNQNRKGKYPSLSFKQCTDWLLN